VHWLEAESGGQEGAKGGVLEIVDLETVTKTISLGSYTLEGWMERVPDLRGCKLPPLILFVVISKSTISSTPPLAQFLLVPRIRLLLTIVRVYI